MIQGEGLLTKGLEYRPGGVLFPIVGPYGVLTQGFIYNVQESWAYGFSFVSVSWTQGFAPEPSVSWTASFQPEPTVSWTLAF